MKKIIINFCIILTVLLSLSYSLCAFTANILIRQALKPDNPNNIIASEKLLNLASKINPLDPEPYYQAAKRLHEKGLQENKMVYLKESLALLLKAQKFNSCSLDVDLLILELHHLLGCSSLQSFSELKILNKKYPNNRLAEKLFVEQGFLMWKNLDQTDREVVMVQTKNLFSDRYWEQLSLLERIIRERNDVELIKKILPLKPQVLRAAQAVISKSGIKFNHLWLEEAILKSQPEIFIKKSAKSFQKIRHTWISKFGKSKEYLSNKELIGWFIDGKEVPEGNLYTNGTVYGILSVAKDSHQFIIQARSSYADNLPAYMLVKIDGRIVGGTYVESKEFQKYIFPMVEKNEQEVLISVSFENDFYDKEKNEDRNLEVNLIRAE